MAARTHYQSLYDVFHLKNTARTQVLAALPFDPLKLVAIDDPENTAPKLVVGFDYNGKGRVIDGEWRIAPTCTHVRLSVLPAVGVEPICVGFGAACLRSDYQDGRFVVGHPELQHQADAVYGKITETPSWKAFFSPALWTRVEGEVQPENWRMIDSCYSFDLTPKQLAAVLNEIVEWRDHPPAYHVLALWGKNCSSFKRAILDASRVEAPLRLNLVPWPGINARLLDFLSGSNLVRSGTTLFQPRRLTQIMYQKAMRELCDPLPARAERQIYVPNAPTDTLTPCR